MVQGQRQHAPACYGDPYHLVERIRRQDDEAFELLYESYSRYLAGVVFRLVGADDETDDILQESFVDAVEKIDQLRDPGSLKAWLVAITVRRVNRVIVARQRRRRLASALSLIAPRTQAPTADASTNDLERAVRALPPKLRVPWILSRVEQLELADVAECCSVSIATAKRRIAAAEDRIRRRLGS